MALVSPGVQVTVIDESFYTPAEPGTSPLIIVATAQDKTNAAGTSTATGTTKANAGKAFRVTSQRDLVEAFGVPFFETTATGNPVHGGERNEYGLLAAYSYLSTSNNAFIVRADVDLNELEGSVTEPGAQPSDGAWWVDTQASTWGIQEWNSSAVPDGGQRFTYKTPLVLTSDDSAKLEGATGIVTSDSYRRPKGSVGSIGDYAVVYESTYADLSGLTAREKATIFYKSPGNSGAGIEAGEWVRVGSPEWVASIPTITSKTVTTLSEGNTFVVNGSTIQVSSGTLASKLSTLAADLSNITGVSAQVSNGKILIYSDGSTEIDGDSTRSGAIKIQEGSGTVTAGTGTGGDLGILHSDTNVYLQPKLEITPHTSVPLYKRTDSIGTATTNHYAGRPTGSVWIKTTEPGNGARWRVKRWNSATQAWVAYSAPIYDTGAAAIYYLDRSGGGLNIPADSVFVQANANEDYAYSTPDDTAGEIASSRDLTLPSAIFRTWRRATTGATTITSKVIAAATIGSTGEKSFTIQESISGQLALGDVTTVTYTATNTAADSDLIATAINAAGFTHVEASVTENNELVISHKTGGDFRLNDATGTTVATLFTVYNLFSNAGTANFYTAASGSGDEYIASNWIPLAADGFTASGDEPLNEPTDGQLWFNPAFSDVDIMIHDGSAWVGYQNFNAAYSDTDPDGPQVAASEPTSQSDGTALVDGDLWISTADLENFPTIYRYNGLLLDWVLIDKADQVTEEGILFADARYGISGANGNTAATIAELLTIDYLDPDAPDPALYPKGMMLWNTRRSGGNVKRYANNYINTAEDNVRFGDESMGDYATDRWVTASPNNEDGSGSFGRKAQRGVVVRALKSVIDTSEEIRDEERRNFNLIACPGYIETLQNQISLNIDRGVTAFVIGDTPLRLRPDATTLTNWGTNALGVFDNGDDGIVSYDEYCAIYYPNGFTTDLSGSNAVVPASHMMLKTIALSDQVSYPWFAPAGTRRGGIVNATSVGYIDSISGEFQTVQLGEGQRDVLYDLKVNPIPFFVGVGHVAFGQKTRARNASSLDRINVARLVVYLRSQLNKLARPYLFEPNDRITRDEIKSAAESLLLELVGLRAIYDFVVVCDETNNTNARIDRNELWLDIAIEPTKAIEFIYIPLRLKNTGEI